ncbi:hypothetical protein IWZ00DRAFT_219155 [Phyllosticta capitalensis]|uniref:Uncharacterized protein n=1 Tax=Phyllosticta capitalensis TaxID=121624 RepID=A0ABR1YTH7_9PEZI
MLRLALTSKPIGNRSETSVNGLGLVKASTENVQHVTIVLFVRRSRNDAYHSTSQLRQLCTMIETMPEFLRDHGNSTVLILHELCSSSAHPMSDRRIFNFIPDEDPVWLLTTNPDRLTRRREEVLSLAQMFSATGGGWLTTGIQDNDSQVSDWVPVDEASASIVQRQLEDGRRRALICAKNNFLIPLLCQNTGAQGAFMPMTNQRQFADKW